ncbi:MAG TPA: DUF371 domain-containing protein [Patescibacteria group bacterium]|nr:DUF371 domain-containing protein [Patescibacteria group bacterium]
MRSLSDTFMARGHPNVTSTNRTTLMITTDPHLTTRGDCILVIRAEKGLRDLNPDLKEAIRSEGSRVHLTMEVGGTQFHVSGKGDPRLPLDHPTDMVIRRSGYICGRTLMIHADKAAVDIDTSFLELLRDEGVKVSVTIRVDL